MKKRARKLTAERADAINRKRDLIEGPPDIEKGPEWRPAEGRWQTQLRHAMPTLRSNTARKTCAKD